MEFGFEPVCDQLRTSFEPAIVMEFGFYLITCQLSLIFTEYSYAGTDEESQPSK